MPSWKWCAATPRPPSSPNAWLSSSLSISKSILRSRRTALPISGVMIHYNCIGAFEAPDRRKIPEQDILMETRKDVALSYAFRNLYTNLEIKNAECNYRIWKRPLISMVLGKQVSGCIILRAGFEKNAAQIYC